MAERSTGLTRTEEDLLEAARGGDGEAFRRLMNAHLADLHAHGYRMLGSLHDAEDALQETLLRARQALANAAYRWDPERGRYVAEALDVLTLEATLVKEMTAFMTPQLFPRFGLPETLSPNVG